MTMVYDVLFSVLAYLALIVHTVVAPVESSGLATPSPVAINDNRRPAGTLKDGTLTLQLRAGVGSWRPEGPTGPALEIEAFGEAAGPLQAPAPLIRVPEGTEIAVSIRNDLDVDLRVQGFCMRGGEPCTPIQVPPATTREARFKTGPAGSYHYWATTTSMPLAFRAAGDTQLSGALIVDPSSATAEQDRVFVITDWTSLTRDQLRELAASDDPSPTFFRMNPRFTALMNGLSWPSTERLTYRVGETVRWRVINLSSQLHPMHLHGFYFAVDSLGDGIRDTSFDDDHRRRVVTQLLQPGATMTMTWRPERAGNWLFHCHTTLHVSPDRRLATAPAAHADHHGATDLTAGMAGMILGITVVDPKGPAVERSEPLERSPRKLTLFMETKPKHYGTDPAYAFAMSEGTDAPPSDQASVPGPLLVLRRGDPVEITLVNNLPEPTSIHWHGMELESYYDGVHGWSGNGGRVTPLIEPGRTFTVRFTPPRAGTFMYHTHMHDNRQLTSGLYGALLVLEPAERFDPDLDHVIVIGRGGPGMAAPVVMNGARDPKFAWKAGVTHRLRFINITPDDVLAVSFSTAEGAVTWRPITKDGAPVPPLETAPSPARQTMAAGETFDFEYAAATDRQTLWIEAKSQAGRWLVQARVVVR